MNGPERIITSYYRIWI